MHKYIWLFYGATQIGCTTIKKSWTNVCLLGNLQCDFYNVLLVLDSADIYLSRFEALYFGLLYKSDFEKHCSGTFHAALERHGCVAIALQWGYRSTPVIRNSSERVCKMSGMF